MCSDCSCVFNSKNYCFWSNLCFKILLTIIDIYKKQKNRCIIMYSRISVYWQKQEIHICKIHMQKKKLVCLILFFSLKKKSPKHIYESNIRCRNTMVSSKLCWRILTFICYIFHLFYWRRLIFRTCFNLQEWNYCSPSFSLTWLTFISFWKV